MGIQSTKVLDKAQNNDFLNSVSILLMSYTHFYPQYGVVQKTVVSSFITTLWLSKPLWHVL